MFSRLHLSFSPPHVLLLSPFFFVFIIFNILLLPLTLAQSSYLSRPRLYLTPTTISTLLSRLSTAAESSREHELLTYYHDRIISTGTRWVSEPIPSSGEWSALYDTHIRKYGNMLPDLALSYLLTSDQQYLTAALAWMDSISSHASWGTDVDLGAAHVLFGFGTAFDWLSGEISGSRRDTYVAKIAHHVGIFVDVVEGDTQWWVDAYMQNHNFVDVCAMVVGARSIEGESSGIVDDEMIQKADTFGYQNFGEVLRWLPPDGASQEGVAYWTYAVESMMRYFLVEARRYGVNRMVSSEWFQKTGDYRFYTSVPPYYSDVVLIADGVPYDWYGPNYILHLLSSMFEKPEYEWMVDVSTTAKEETSGRSNVVEWRSLLWYDPGVVPSSPTELGFPLQKHFEDMGIYTSRSSWDVVPVGEVSPAPSTMFVTKAAPPGGHVAAYECTGCGHVHPDEGSFILYYDGFPLIQDNGYSYWKKTWSHNLVTFGNGGIGQYGEDAMWFSTSSFNREEGDCSIPKLEVNYRSEYLVADLTRMYPLSLGLQLYRRHFVWAAKKYLLIADHIILENATTIKRHFHSDRDGEISGYSFSSEEHDCGYTIHDIVPPAGTFLSSGAFDYSHTHAESGTTHEYHSLIMNFTTPSARDVILFSLVMPYRLVNYSRPTFRQKLRDDNTVLTLWFDEVQITLDVPNMQMIENEDWRVAASAVGAVLGIFAGIVFVVVLVVIICMTSGASAKLECLKKGKKNSAESDGVAKPSSSDKQSE